MHSSPNSQLLAPSYLLQEVKKNNSILTPSIAIKKKKIKKNA